MTKAEMMDMIRYHITLGDVNVDDFVGYTNAIIEMCAQQFVDVNEFFLLANAIRELKVKE